MKSLFLGFSIFTVMSMLSACGSSETKASCEANDSIDTVVVDTVVADTVVVDSAQ